MAKKKIVVLHNAVELAEDIAELLRFTGFDVLTATNGETGLTLIYDYMPDLVLSDWKMIGLDGYELLAHIRNDPLLAPTPFVFMASAGNELRFVREGMDLGADDYLALPIEPNTLVLCVQARLKRHAQILGLPIEESQVSPRRIKHHVFLSYAREDSLIMQRLKHDMQQAHLTVWTDENLEPGTPSWTDAIQEAIETTGCVVVILSPDAKKSEWVNRELEYAAVHGIRPFPILTRGSEREAKPIQLIRIQHIDIRNDYESKMIALFDVIRLHIGIIG